MGGLLKMFNNATMLGLWDDVGDAISDTIGRVVGSILWLLCDIFFIILDLFESLFRAFAGISEKGIKINGEVVEGDIVLYLTQSNLVQQIFISILILSLFLLIIFTIFAIVKNQYAEKQEPVSKFVNNAFKALFMYLLVPVATIVCLMVGNVVLQAIDGATRPTNSVSSSGMLFTTAAYNANKLRDDDLSKDIENLKYYYKHDMIVGAEVDIQRATGVTEDNVDQIRDRETMEIIASIIDEHFVNGDLNPGFGDTKQWNFNNVSNFYHSLEISYLVIWVGGAMLIGAIGKIAWGLVSRVFKMTLYFAISPAIMATYPIDNGKALGAWRGEMVKNGTMAFVAVGVLNVLYSILPAFRGIQIGSGIGALIIELFIMIIAFNGAKDMISSVSGWFGVGNAFDEGAKASQTVSKPFKTMATAGLGAFVGARAGYKSAKEIGDAQKFWSKAGLKSAFTGGFAGAGVGSKSLKEMQDKLEKTRKAGEQAYIDSKTKHLFSGQKRDGKAEEFAARQAIFNDQKTYDIAHGKLTAQQRAERKRVVDMRARGEITVDEATDMYKEINERYKKAEEKLKAGMSFVKALTEQEEQMIQTLESNLEKRSRSFAHVERVQNASVHSDHLMEQVISMSGASKTNIQAHWEEILQGDFKNVDGGFKKKIQEAYKSMSSEFLSVNREITEAKDGVQRAISAGDNSLSRIFAGSIDVDGKITNFNAAVAKANAEEEKYNKAQKEIKAKKDELLKKQTNFFDTADTFDSATLETIGKNLNKK